eukprot:GHVN01085516.1.p1 GENE.GHVN01085516.1~~GHVN01085516.1.p1  ORF type:complete len:278 (-),score=41.69 GHVN01085516.1:125-958(-)
METKITLFVRDLRGKTTTFYDIQPSERVDMFKVKVQETLGCAAGQQRLIFNSHQLEDEKTLGDYGIKDMSTIHVVLRLRGMISTFTSNDISDPLVNLLMLTDEQRDEAEVPVDLLTLKAENERADPTKTFYLDRKEVIPQPLCHLLSSFLEFLWNETAASSPNDRVDMRVSVADDAFTRLAAVVDESLPAALKSDKLLSFFRELFLRVRKDEPMMTSQSNKVALRMTRGPTNACIDFHCDGTYATSTSQIALNCPSEYEGASPKSTPWGDTKEPFHS